jgi:site-specific DNA-methyltransferase (adenine-specific)
MEEQAEYKVQDDSIKTAGSQSVVERGVTLPAPYYEEDGITIYHAKSEDIMASLTAFNVVVTDPPYPDYYEKEYAYYDGILNFLIPFSCKQIVFWTAKVAFPLDYTAIHIWDKKAGCGSQYERIFERNGGKDYKMFRHYLINSTVAASFTGDVFTGHKSQKPEKLMKEVIEKFSKPGDIILDPFMGSGSTLKAAKELGRKAVGIEMNKDYCDIAVDRLRQQCLPF